MERKRKDGVDKGKDGAVNADRERQRENGRRREAGWFSERAGGIAQILPEIAAERTAGRFRRNRHLSVRLPERLHEATQRLRFEEFLNGQIACVGRWRLGLRYTLNFPSTVAGNRGAVFNLGTQRLAFSGRMVCPRPPASEAGYLGSKLTRLGVPDVNLNQLTVEQLALDARLLDPVPDPYVGDISADAPLGRPTVPRAQLLRPYPRFTTVSLYRNSTGHSTYHSLQTRIEKRFSGGLTFTAAYTFSRLIDDAVGRF
jgi:hypothetical protein